MEGSGSATIKNVAHLKHPEVEETSPNRNHIITGKQQQKKLDLSSQTEVIDPLPFTYKKNNKNTNNDTKHLLQKHLVRITTKPPP